MLVHSTRLKDCLIIEPKIFGDERGYFLETFQAKRYEEMAGITERFVQDNHSRSARGVLRGLHFQKTKPQGKLVRVVNGEVLDVAVDLRPQSDSFGQWEAVLLSSENKRQLWVPPGFGHGFIVLSEFADFTYKCTDYYDPSDEGGIFWNDEELGVDWGLDHFSPDFKPTVSDKDAVLPTFAEIKSKLIK